MSVTQASAKAHCQPYSPSSTRCRSPALASRLRMLLSAAGMGSSRPGRSGDVAGRSPGRPDRPAVPPPSSPHGWPASRTRCSAGHPPTSARTTPAAGALRPVRCARVVVVELRPADPAVRVSASNPRSSRCQPVPAGVAAHEGQVVRLVLVGDTAAFVALAVTDLDVHGARRSAASGSSARPGSGTAPRGYRAQTPAARAPRSLGRRPPAGCWRPAPGHRCPAGRR